MRFHSHFLSIETLLSGERICTPKSLGLTLPGEFRARGKSCRYSTALVMGAMGSDISAPNFQTLERMVGTQDGMGGQDGNHFHATAGGTLELLRLLLQAEERIHILYTAPEELENLYKRLCFKRGSNGKLPQWDKVSAAAQDAITKVFKDALTQHAKYTKETTEQIVHLKNSLRLKAFNPNLNSNLIASNPVCLHAIPYDDVWMRDTGPLFLASLNDVASNPTERNRFSTVPAYESTKIGGALIFRFNGWGEKYPYQQDATLATQFIQQLRHKGYLDHYEDFFLFETDFSCEGGALESNGVGLAVTTNSVILNPNRRNTVKNPVSKILRPLEQVETEHVLKELLGLDTVLCLATGLSDDDTDGHIDNICRFVDKHTILVAAPPEAGFATYTKPLTTQQADKEARLLKTLHAHHEKLSAYTYPLEASTLKTPQHSGLNIIPLPLPPPVYDKQTGNRLAQSYLNYLQLKHKILVPSYHLAYEKLVNPMVAKTFPEHEICWIDWNRAIHEGGGVHCLTQHLPF